jgi:hypothetical protein
MTTTRRLALLGFLASLAAASGAAGAEIQTDVLFSNANTEVDYKCTLTNLGTKPIDANFLMTNTAGIVENDLDLANIGVGVTVSAVVFGDDAGGVHCRVSGKFSKSAVRVTLQLVDEVAGAAGITRVVVPGR